MNTLVSNIAALQSLTVTSLTNGETLQVGGYYTIGDGGGGLFFYDSASTVTPSPGIIFAPSIGAGRFFRVIETPQIQAMWFGVKPDANIANASSNTTNLQAAIDYCLAHNARELILPNGSIVINAPLQVGTAAAGTDNQSCFTITGQGMLTNAGVAAPGGSDIAMIGSSSPPQAAILNIGQSPWRFLEFKRFTLTCLTLDNALVGVNFAYSNFSGFLFDAVRICYATTSVKINVNGGGNGEFTTFNRCRFEGFTNAFYNVANQAFAPRFYGCEFQGRKGSTIFNLFENPGGLALACDSSWMNASEQFPQVNDGINRIAIVYGVNNDPFNVIGGRWESVDTLVSFSAPTAEIAGQFIFFKNLIATSFEDNANVIEASNNDYAARTVGIEGCTFQAQDVNGAPIPWRVDTVGCTYADIKITNCNFVALQPVIAYEASNQSEAGNLRLGNRSCVVIEDCTLYNVNLAYGAKRTIKRNQWRSGALDLMGSRQSFPFLPHGGRQQNLLLQSAFGSVTGAVAAVPPWYHGGASSTFISGTSPVSSTFYNANGITPFGQRIVLAPLSSVHQDITSSLDLSTITTKYVTYQASVAVRNGAQIRFAFVNSDNEAIIYDQVILKASDADYLPTLIEIHAVIPPQVSGKLRLLIETISPGAQGTITFNYQFVCNYFDGVFVPTTIDPVTRTQFWDSFGQNGKFLNRFQVPIKTDVFGTSAQLANVEGEIYQSSDTGKYRMSFPEGWGTLPKQDEGANPPTSGTWPQGWIRWNSSPVSSGTIGWVCTNTGTPGTWKTFGSIAA